MINFKRGKTNTSVSFKEHENFGKLSEVLNIFNDCLITHTENEDSTTYVLLFTNDDNSGLMRIEHTINNKH